MIARLPEAKEALTINVTINSKLRPYLTQWYTRKKQDGETPETFILRVLKTNAINDYLQDQSALNLQEMQDDANLMNTEVD